MVLDTPCILCKSNEDDEVNYGKVFTDGKFNVHHYCLLLTHQSFQRGKDEEGFEGFLIHDIKNIAKKIQSRVCFICKEKSANLKCGHKKSKSQCRKWFHMKCAILNEVQIQFSHKFPIFCKTHKKKVDSNESRPLDDVCFICYEKLDKQKSSILIPCCKNGWTHEYCLKKYALFSGSYAFKCPLCGERDACLEKLPQMNIFIPVRDSQWELDNDFAEIAVPPKLECFRCETNKHSDKLYKWKLCFTCGANGIHYNCWNEETAYKCKECAEIEENLHNEKLEQQKERERLEKKKLAEEIFLQRWVQFGLLVSDEELSSSDEESIKPIRKKNKRKNEPSSSSEDSFF